MALVDRELNVSFSLAGGLTFAGSGAAKTYSGLRVSSKTVITGSMSGGGQSQIAVFGMSLSDMNELSTLGMAVQKYNQNGVTLQAIDDHGTTEVFTGEIVQCWPDMSASPEVCLQVVANIGQAAAGKPIPATSYAGATDVAQILQTLAGQGGFTFENNGVSIKLSNPYFPGTLRQQIKEVIKAAGCYGTIDANNTLAIWNRSGSRNSAGNVSLSPTTGMVGYPAFFNQGILVQSIYIPDAKPGGSLTISGSQLTSANGTYTIASVVHDLESQVLEGGKWFTTLQAYVGSAGQGFSNENVGAGQ